MRTILLSIPLFFSIAISHPGIGIVRDSRGNVFYTDLKHVWKISPDGTRTIAVRNVHTHELFIDADDNLYGEHLWYEGGKTDRWGHRVWRLAKNGSLSDVIPARRGFREDYGDMFFVRDAGGNMYWADRGDTTIIRKRAPSGKVTSLASDRFENVRFMTATPNGTVYLIDLHHLVQVSQDGRIRRIAANLADTRRAFLFFTDSHAIMGIWTDGEENVYAAVSSDKAVKRVSPNGTVEILYRESAPWSPTGGLIDPNGALWMLQTNAANDVRVKCVRRDGSEKVY